MPAQESHRGDRNRTGVLKNPVRKKESLHASKLKTGYGFYLSSSCPVRFPVRDEKLEAQIFWGWVVNTA